MDSVETCPAWLDGGATAGSIVATEHFTSAKIDLEEGGAVALRPDGTFGVAEVNWQNSSDTVIGRIGMQGTTSLASLEIITIGSGRDIEMRPGGNDGLTLDAGSLATKETRMFIYIEGTGFRRGYIGDDNKLTFDL